MNNPRRVYKFICQKWGMKALENKRLKITDIATTNDPYDLLPCDLTDSQLRSKLNDLKVRVGMKQGLLCFSASTDSPVQWAHYANSHKGLCLGFDIPNSPETVHDVIYRKTPLTLVSACPTAEEYRSLLLEKYDHWYYEKEVRVFTPLAAGVLFDELRFHPFDQDLVLKEVVLGCCCGESRESISAKIGGHPGDVDIWKVRPAYDAFRMVKDESFTAIRGHPLASERRDKPAYSRE